MNTLARGLLLAAALIGAWPMATRAEIAPATQPAAAAAAAAAGDRYRMTRQGVAGLASPQWVFVIVTPQGHPWVAADSKLQWMIEQAVPAGGTLEWSPGCKRIGGEPLETAEALAELKAFCAARGVTLVHIPGG
jgi:hypothetical protein